MNRKTFTNGTRTIPDCQNAIRSGLDFICRTTRVSSNFESYGHDYLSCFYCIASTSKDAGLRRAAGEMGKELARRWRKDNPRVPRNAGVREIIALVYGSYAADGLGVKGASIKREIRAAARKFSGRDYLDFDPATEPPPLDIPAECSCQLENERGQKKCAGCGKRLRMLTPYAVWLDALTVTYTGDHYGVRMGASYADVLKWLPLMRPYPDFINPDDWNFYDATYAITHVVYTLNDYGRYRLRPRLLKHEYSFLRRNLTHALVMDDPEMVGEFVDSLKFFGLRADHPLVLKGVRYLLAKQNVDGSWGDTSAEDIYNRYHPTWTAIDGLREYSRLGNRLSFPGLALLLKNSTSRLQPSCGTLRKPAVQAEEGISH